MPGLHQIAEAQRHHQGAVTLPLGGTGTTITIPALSVRRAETTVELGSGQSFAIAGLLQRNTAQVQDGVNGLGDLPVLGALFRSDRFQRAERLAMEAPVKMLLPLIGCIFPCTFIVLGFPILMQLLPALG